MIHTPITDAFGLSCPILSIGMGWEGLPQLAAAVSNAGGLGFVGASVSSRGHLGEILRRTRDLTGRPFGVGMCTPSTGQLRACLTERPAVVAFLEVAPRQAWIDALHRAHIRVWIEAGSPAEARSAVRHGADALIVHAEGVIDGLSSSELVNLLPAIASAVSPVPIVTTGGIADGRKLAAALVLGADAACCAARLLGSAEGGIGRRVVTSERLPRPRIAAFPHVRRDDGAGASELVEVLPSPDVVGEVEERITGFSRGIRGVAPAIVQPASEIVREISEEAERLLDALVSVITQEPAPRR